MSAREAVFTAVRTALGRRQAPQEARAAVARRIASPTPNLLPRLDADLVAVFRVKAQAASCTVDQIAGPDEIRGAVGRYLDEQGWPRRLRIAAELATLGWDPDIAAEAGAADPADAVSLVPAFAGIAETGSLVLLSGPDHPTTLNFVPEHHIVILPANRLVGHQEDVWALLRQECQTMPRTVNIITGPSRTADVDQIVQIGVHGPKSVHCLLMGDESGLAADERG